MRRFEQEALKDARRELGETKADLSRQVADIREESRKGMQDLRTSIQNMAYQLGDLKKHVWEESERRRGDRTVVRNTIITSLVSACVGGVLALIWEMVYRLAHGG